MFDRSDETCARRPRRIEVITGPERRREWPDADKTLDGLDAWRCSAFRNEGAGLSSTLILEAMRLTRELWTAPPPDEWLTFVDRRKVVSTNPGYCFKQAGWWLDSVWSHRYMVRLRAHA